jgi:hypothetical protein
VINKLIEQYGHVLFPNLFQGIIFNFSKVHGIIADVADIVYLTTKLVGIPQTIQLVQGCVEQFPVQEMSNELKQKFMIKMKRYFCLTSVIEQQEVGRIASVMRDFAAAYARRNLINSRK